MIYLDNAATTRTAKEVLETMLPYFYENYGNPSAVYSLASRSKSAVSHAREQAASLIHASASEIYFTSGGSESDNWALRGIAEAYADRGKHIITTKIEHHAILRTCEYLEHHGVEVTYLDVDQNGMVSLEDVERAIRPDTILVSVMAANNEIGTIEPIREIGRICHEKGVLFHTDAVQAMGHIPLDVKEDQIDLLSASGHKLNGPKGVGLLYIRKGVKIRSLIHGGSQEHGRRAGTENVPGIVGLGTACCLAEKSMEERSAYETNLRNYAIRQLSEKIPDLKVSGDLTRRLPNNIHIRIPGAEGQMMLILLDQKGICASSGSACSSGSLDPSHVLKAIGVPDEEAACAIRLTLSHETTKEEIDEAVDAVSAAASQLRGK